MENSEYNELGEFSECLFYDKLDWNVVSNILI